MISARRRQEIIDALRRGTVPHRGLDALAVGTDRWAPTFDAELAAVANGGWGFKAIRGEYGAGKTFLVRWLEERAWRVGFATAEVQVSERETPLDRLETVYRRVVEQLATSDERSGALRSVVDGWFFTLEQDVLASGGPAGDRALLEATEALAEQRLADVGRRAPAFSAALRGYRRALAAGDTETAEGLLAWLGGQPHVSASIKRSAGIKGDLDHDSALAFLAGLCLVLRDAGYAGLIVVLDEVETVQRVRSDARDRGLNALRQLIDEVDSGRYAGLYVVLTGTPAFFEGPQGAQRLPPLAQRLHTDFGTDERFDNPRAVQIRLPGFSSDRLVEVGVKVRDLYAAGAAGTEAQERIGTLVDDAYLATLARAVAGELGRRVGVAPRLYLKKLVGDVLDRVDLFAEFDPRRDYQLTVADTELTEVERNARAAASVDDIDLDV